MVGWQWSICDVKPLAVVLRQIAMAADRTVSLLLLPLLTCRVAGRRLTAAAAAAAALSSSFSSSWLTDCLAG